MRDTRVELAATRVLDVLLGGPVLAGPLGGRWAPATVHLTHRLFGADVEVITRTDGTEAGNAAFDRYQLTLAAVHLLEDIGLVRLYRDPHDARAIARIGLADHID